MKIAVFFPGIGYHCDKPLLYYARKLVQEYGYEKTVMQEYSYNGKNIRGDKKKMQEAFESLYAQAEKKLEEIAFDEYSEVLFISKSVGTIIASAYAEKYKIKCCQILYTPLEQTFMFEHDDAIAFIGTADPWSDVKKVIECSKNQAVPIYVYEDANHSLEKENILIPSAYYESVGRKHSQKIPLIPGKRTHLHWRCRINPVQSG